MVGTEKIPYPPSYRRIPIPCARYPLPVPSTTRVRWLLAHGIKAIAPWRMAASCKKFASQVDFGSAWISRFDIDDRPVPADQGKLVCEMAGWMTFVFVAVAMSMSMVESRVIPAEPVSMMLDSYGNPIVFLREKRMAAHPYPHRAMMFTGYYRPVRRSSNGGQATGVFAQGNAVSGGAFFGGVPHLKDGPEPAEEPEVSSAEAQAAPGPEDSYAEEEEQQAQVGQGEENYQQEEHQQQEEEHLQEGQPQQEEQQQQQEQPQDELPPQDQHESEPVPVFTTEAASVTPAEEPAVASTEGPVSRPKTQHAKKTKKNPVPVEEDEEDEYEDEEPVVPFIPFKGNRRRQGYPNLNNFFPMVFSFPGGAARSGTPGSPPGTITAIANSYSTGKGGVASSMATAYGGSPNGKKRTTPATESS
ncbi:hypothetical protein KM043_017005 [Ampulex compressa]|nr:hypothetical protein KM043_017005 [Ampulex compressa]